MKVKRISYQQGVQSFLSLKGSDIPKTSSSTIPATVILPATCTPTTATARATTSLDATSASTRSSASSDIHPANLVNQRSKQVMIQILLAELQQDAKSFHKLKNGLLGQAKCNWNPLARRHLAAGMMPILYASFTGVEQLIPCVVAAIFGAADIKVDTKSLPKNCPSENLLKEIVRDGAVDCLLWLMDELKKAHAVFLACNKGNRKGVFHLAKVLSWWHGAERCVRSVCLDIDGSGGSSENVGDAIDHLLKKLIFAGLQTQTQQWRGRQRAS
jgi:hypothetical protein